MGFAAPGPTILEKLIVPVVILMLLHILLPHDLLNTLRLGLLLLKLWKHPLKLSYGVLVGGHVKRSTSRDSLI